MTATDLGSVVLPVNKWDPRKSDVGTFTYLDLSGIDQRLKAITAPAMVKPSEAPSRARQLVACGDVLVSTVRPNLNAVAHVGSEFEGATASTGFCVLRPKPGDLHDRYLFHWVKSNRFVDEMERQATGASYPAVSDKIVKASAIPLPPIEEQRRIAAVLDAADALRAKRRQALAKLDTLTQAIFIDMFGAPGQQRFPERPLGELVRARITRGIDQPGPEVPDGIPYIKTTNFGAGHPTRESLARAAPEIADRFALSFVETGDTVICIRATVGPALLVDRNLDGVNLSRGTARVSPSRDVLPEFLFAAICSTAFQRQIEARLRGATFLQIPLGELKALMVPVPPLGLQGQMVQASTSVQAQRAAQAQQAEHFDTLFASLQQRAFRGEL